MRADDSRLLDIRIINLLMLLIMHYLMVSTDVTEGRKFLSRAFLLEKGFDSSTPGPASKYRRQ